MDLFNNFKNLIKHINYLAILAIIGAIGLAVFAAILEDVYTKDPKIIAFDIAVTLAIASTRTQLLTDFFKVITSLGNLVPFVLIFIGSILIFIILKKYIGAITLFLTVLGGQLIVYIIKLIIQRSRPESIYALIPEDGFSFPSGHAFIAVCFWGVLGYLVIKHIKNIYLKIFALIFFLGLVLAIGFSRIYLGVHWTSDVIASFSLATVFCIFIFFLVSQRGKFYKELRFSNKQ